MKIALGINSFPSEQNRFKLAEQSYTHLDKLDNCTVYDIQRPGIKGSFKTIDKLQRTARDVIDGATKELPFVNDLFNIMAEVDSDYFIITNTDIMISPRLIKHILDNDITALPCSRLDVSEPNSLNDSMIPLKWELAGFDTFCFKTKWYREHSWLFEDFLLGRPWYDHSYASLMKIFGNNDILGNKNPAFCMHIYHGNDACIGNNPEFFYNEKQYNESQLIGKYKHSWDNFFKDILLPGRAYLHRTYLNEIKNESVIEKQFFANYIEQLNPDIENIRKLKQVIKIND